MASSVNSIGFQSASYRTCRLRTITSSGAPMRAAAGNGPAIGAPLDRYLFVADRDAAKEDEEVVDVAPASVRRRCRRAGEGPARRRGGQTAARIE